MYRDIPTTKRVLKIRWERRLMNIHKQKLKTMKPMIKNNMQTIEYKHLSRKLKREQIYEGK